MSAADGRPAWAYELDEKVRANSHRLEFRPFAETDWFGFAGGLPFEGEVEPVIANINLTDAAGVYEAQVVLDVQGLFLQAMLVGDDDGASERTFACEYPLAARAVAMMRDGMSIAELLGMPGVEEVSS